MGAYEGLYENRENVSTSPNRLYLENIYCNTDGNKQWRNTWVAFCWLATLW